MTETTSNGARPEYLFTVKDQEDKSIPWTHPQEIDQLHEGSPEDSPFIIVIDAAFWDAQGAWDDDDPFDEISDQFGLIQETECIYSPYGAATYSSALTQMLADPRFQRDDSI